MEESNRLEWQNRPMYSGTQRDISPSMLIRITTIIHIKYQNNNNVLGSQTVSFDGRV